MGSSDLRLPTTRPATLASFHCSVRTGTVPAATEEGYFVKVPVGSLVVLRTTLIRLSGTSPNVTVTMLDENGLTSYGTIYENANAVTSLYGPWLMVAGTPVVVPRGALTGPRLLFRFFNNDVALTGQWQLDFTALPSAG